jgi:hypothetical protein
MGGIVAALIAAVGAGAFILVALLLGSPSRLLKNPLAPRQVS